MSDYKRNSKILIGYLGGSENIVTVTNCMTRLRVTVKDESLTDEDKIKEADDVIGLVHDRAGSFEIVVGPGKSRKYADQFREFGFSSNPGNDEVPDWKSNKEKLKSLQKGGRIKNGLKLLGDIFVPLIPGVITAGLCAGFAALIAQAIPDYDNSKVWSVIYDILTLVNYSFMTYMTAWAGYRAAERFGATPIMGGMLGMITSLSGIDDIAKLLGLYNDDHPLNSILRDGKGGVLAVIMGVFLLSVLEKNTLPYAGECGYNIYTAAFAFNLRSSVHTDHNAAIRLYIKRYRMGIH